MAVMIKLYYDKIAVDTGRLNELVTEKLGDVWEYPIAVPSGVSPKRFYVHLTKKMKAWKTIGKRNIRVGSAIVIKLPKAVVTERPRPDEEDGLWKIFVNDSKAATVLREAGFDVDLFDFWYVEDEAIIEVLEDRRRVWND